MGTLYLIDAHNPVLLSSKINDTVNLPTGQTHSIRGSFPVNLPFDVPMDGAPTDVNDLITKKYQGILTIYPGFNHILFDEQIDALGWNASSSVGFTLGERQNNCVHGNVSDILISNTQAMASTPDICVIRYEFFRYIETDPSTGQYTRSYEDISDDPDLHVTVSFDNGASSVPALSGVLVNIPLSNRGNQFQITFHRSPGGAATYIGSWSVVY